MLDDVFISDLLGVEKPNIEFFDKVFETIGNYDKDEVLIIGDSLTSDIKGGNNAGILTCFYDPKKTNNFKGLKVDYHITNLQELLDIL
jgi:FMN phosphatase YigB (HAD superfamily)